MSWYLLLAGLMIPIILLVFFFSYFHHVPWLFLISHILEEYGTVPKACSQKSLQGLVSCDTLEIIQNRATLLWTTVSKNNIKHFSQQITDCICIAHHSLHESTIVNISFVLAKLAKPNYTDDSANPNYCCMCMYQGMCHSGLYTCVQKEELWLVC